MGNLMDNKYIMIGLSAVIIVALVAGFIFVSKQKKGEESVVSEKAVEEQAIEMSPEDIGLELSSNKSKTEVVMKISDVSKFTSFEYEMNYDAVIDGESVPRGAIGSGDTTDGKAVERSITIGTCSSGKCKYDTGVTKVSFVIRLNLKDGKTGVVKKEINLD